MKENFYTTHIKDFIGYINGSSASKSKKETFRTDLERFLSFLENLSEKAPDDASGSSQNKSRAETFITEGTFSAYTEDMKTQGLSSATIKRRLSTLRSYGRYLHREYGAPLHDIPDPDTVSGTTGSLSPGAPAEQETLSPAQVAKLTSDILRNDSYLPEGSTTPLSIPDDVRIRRDPLILRNAAIVQLLLGTGISITELCALDLRDVNTEWNFAIIQSGKKPRTVHYGNTVSSALHDYINGTPIPADLMDRYMFTRTREYEWCRSNSRKRTAEAEIDGQFPDSEGYDDEFRHDMLLILRNMRRNSGRKDFTGSFSSPALFMSSKGQRMSVRMVQHMVSEMIRTYVPEYIGEASAETLRKTYALEMMKKTHGNSSIVTWQMGQEHLPECAKIDISSDKKILKAH